MITSNQNKKPDQSENKKLVETTQKIKDSIDHILDEKKLDVIIKSLERIDSSDDIEKLTKEIKSLKEVIENNSVQEWQVDINRDKWGFITSLKYIAVK
jgi:hypothetical protein